MAVIWVGRMNSEAEKLLVIRTYLEKNFPACHMEDGARTNVDRTLLVFQGLEVKCTIQVSLRLLQDNHLTSADLASALKRKDIAGLVSSSPVVYLRHNQLAINEP
jgi:hypothetical protein